MTDVEPCFVDTNVLLSATDRDRAAHREALEFLTGGLNGSERLYASGQVFREYLVVATRPRDDNGLGQSPREASENLIEFRRCLHLLEETAAVAEHLQRLVAAQGLRGKRIHDANIVATMLTHGLRRVRTYNPKDFEEFRQVAVDALDC